MVIQGSRVRELRKSKGLNQAGLAELLGLHPATVSSLECGRSELSMLKFRSLVSLLDTNADYLLGLTDCQLSFKETARTLLALHNYLDSRQNITETTKNRRYESRT